MPDAGPKVPNQRPEGEVDRLRPKIARALDYFLDDYDSGALDVDGKIVVGVCWSEKPAGIVAYMKKKKYMDAIGHKKVGYVHATKDGGADERPTLEMKEGSPGN